MATLGKKYIYLNGESWMVKGPNYSQKVRKFMFKTYGGNEQALLEAQNWRDVEEQKLKEIADGQIVLQSQFEDQQRKLRELQELDYKRLLEKEALEKFQKQKKKKEDEDAAWVASEHKLDDKLWKIEQNDNFQNWAKRYPEAAASLEGKTIIKDGYIAAGMFGVDKIPSVDNIQKGYKNIVQNTKIKKITELFPAKNAIVSYK
jgi:hypothetical protein